MTTTTRKIKHSVRICSDCYRALNSSNTRHYRAADTCDDCMELAGIYNDHQDGRHEDQPVDDCIGCGYVIPDRSRKGHAVTTTIPKEMQSHAACYAANAHPKTKAGREACRKARNV